MTSGTIVCGLSRHETFKFDRADFGTPSPKQEREERSGKERATVRR